MPWEELSGRADFLTRYTSKSVQSSLNQIHVQSKYPEVDTGSSVDSNQQSCLVWVPKRRDPGSHEAVAAQVNFVTARVAWLALKRGYLPSVSAGLDQGLIRSNQSKNMQHRAQKYRSLIVDCTRVAKAHTRSNESAYDLDLSLQRLKCKWKSEH